MRRLESMYRALLRISAIGDAGKQRGKIQCYLDARLKKLGLFPENTGLWENASSPST